MCCITLHVTRTCHFKSGTLTRLYPPYEKRGGKICSTPPNRHHSALITETVSTFLDAKSGAQSRLLLKQIFFGARSVRNVSIDEEEAWNLSLTSTEQIFAAHGYLWNSRASPG